MIRFWNRIAIWSSLHELVRISGSSHGSNFESPVYRVQNGYKSESPITEFGSHERVRNPVTRNQTHRDEGKINTYTKYTHTRTHTCTPHVHTYTGNPHTYMLFTHTYITRIMDTHTYTCKGLTHAHTNRYTLNINERTHLHIPIRVHTSMHACIHK